MLKKATTPGPQSYSIPHFSAISFTKTQYADIQEYILSGNRHGSPAVIAHGEHSPHPPQPTISPGIPDWSISRLVS